METPKYKEIHITLASTCWLWIHPLSHYNLFTFHTVICEHVNVCPLDAHDCSHLERCSHGLIQFQQTTWLNHDPCKTNNRGFACCTCVLYAAWGVAYLCSFEESVIRAPKVLGWELLLSITTQFIYIYIDRINIDRSNSSSGKLNLPEPTTEIELVLRQTDSTSSFELKSYDLSAPHTQMRDRGGWVEAECFRRCTCFWSEWDT